MAFCGCCRLVWHHIFLSTCDSKWILLCNYHVIHLLYCVLRVENALANGCLGYWLVSHLQLNLCFLTVVINRGFGVHYHWHVIHFNWIYPFQGLLHWSWITRQDRCLHILIVPTILIFQYQIILIDNLTFLRLMNSLSLPKIFLFIIF